MASAVAFRTERVWRSPRYTITTLPNSPSSLKRVSKQVRCFGAGKGPTDKDNDKYKKGPTDKDIDRKNNEKDTYKKVKEVPLRFPPPVSWGNQIHRLRPAPQPRFGPKSHKVFQAATNPQKKYGMIRNLNLKLVKDRCNVPILIPGRLLKEDSDNNNNNNNKEEKASTSIHNTTNTGKDDELDGGKLSRRRRRKLPMVNAAAILDKNTYCKRSAFPGGTTSKSGHAAASRLLKGKKDLVDMIRGTIVYQQSQRPFCLTGHGIPPQLLQDHIDLADSILKNFDEPAECQLISNLDDSNNSADPSCPDSMTIRRHDGQTRIWAWPPQRLLQQSVVEDGEDGDENENDNTTMLHDISQTWDNSLVLYLAVMDRLSKELGPSAIGSYLNRGSRKNWNVKMYRGMAYPIELISRPDDEEDGRPVPILEWSPRNSGANSNNDKIQNQKHPQVSIRLQGTPTTANNDVVDNDEAPLPNAVTLVYDAVFQEDPRVEPVPS